MTKYAWKKGCGFYKADANKVAEEIFSIGNEVTPEQIVEKAKDEETELHKCFEWDDRIAGEKYRKWQARDIVCKLVIQEEEVPKDRPETRVLYKTDATSGYKPTEYIVRKKDEYEALLERAWAELRAFKAKYSMLKELDEILELID